MIKNGTSCIRFSDSKILSYNIRGWLNAINDVRDIESENDLFAFKINYNELDSFSENDNSPTPLFNGNIAATYWRTDSDNTMRKYNYSYDNLNRLLEANYSKPDNVSTPDNYLEQLTYDKNGNIQTIFRNGDMDTDGAQSINTIDELVFTYDTTNKNLLKKVIDLAIAPQGFDEGQDDSNGITDPTNDYDYDLNGNMISDTNKGITSILYNHLNLPTKIVFNNSEATKITYLYNAVGQKIKKTVTQGDVVSTEYLSGFQYKNAVLQFFPHAEGYVKYTPASGKGSVAKYNYIFNYTDHLGNVRLSYATDPSDGVLKIIEENHYYPFGLKHSNYNSDQLILEKSENEILKFVPTNPLLTSTYNYKYGNKELQDELGLNMYDFGARNYDPALGRWMNIDPLAEKSKRFSPYVYALNNPIFFVDPDGMLSDDFINDLWKKSGNNTTWTNNDNGTFSSDNNNTIGYQQDEKSRAIEAKGAYGKMITEARKDGKNMAADNLQRWLDGKGGTKTISFKWLRGNREIIAGEERNNERFEEQITNIGEGLADGESKSFSNYWDAQVTGGIFGELYYASGTSTITSRGNFKVTRKGDNIVVSGSITHSWRDTYDWHAGASAYIPGVMYQI